MVAPEAVNPMALPQTVAGFHALVGAAAAPWAAFEEAVRRRRQGDVPDTGCGTRANRLKQRKKDRTYIGPTLNLEDNTTRHVRNPFGAGGFVGWSRLHTASLEKNVGFTRFFRLKLQTHGVPDGQFETKGWQATRRLRNLRVCRATARGLAGVHRQVLSPCCPAVPWAPPRCQELNLSGPARITRLALNP